MHSTIGGSKRRKSNVFENIRKKTETDRYRPITYQWRIQRGAKETFTPSTKKRAKERDRERVPEPVDTTYH